ncbi:MAG TPA: hypothetical protein VFD70_02805 [Anaerolineae bacterium]|nr:hypothetical protein [Anaerolineae bacterium]
MSILTRFPSRTDILSVFAVCVIPIFVWALISYFYAVPGFVLRFSIWDLVGTASYILAFALIESIVILLPFILLAAILPSRFFKDHFTALASSIILISSAWVMVANYQDINFADWNLAQFLPFLLLYLISIAIPILVILRSKRIEQIIQALIRQVSVLGYVYVALACISVLIVIIRNL